MKDSPYEWLQKATLKELVNQVIWESVMEGTAHCGWTDRARAGLVKSTQESVQWALAQKLTPEQIAQVTPNIRE